jgi:hypothetical protein
VKMRAIMYVLIVALAVFNGVFSPRSFVVFALQGIWYPEVLPAPLTQMFILSGMISALLHLLVTGVPVALFERMTVPRPILSAILWLAIIMLPTFQTLQHLNWL